jgi:DNA-3-methyladenine glycosylase II
MARRRAQSKANATDWTAARQHLARVDPVMKRIVRRVGPCGLAPRNDHFLALCKSIFSQQLSTRIASMLFERFCAVFPRKRPTPRRVLDALAANVEALAGCGLSRQKRAYIEDLARRFDARQITTRGFARMTDEHIIETLIKVKGVGRWTAEMFLIFVLNRPDVWPADDLGLQESYKRHFDLPKRPTRKELLPLGDRFAPYRSVATWYLWRALALQTSKRAQTPRSGAAKS